MLIKTMDRILEDGTKIKTDVNLETICFTSPVLIDKSYFKNATSCCFSNGAVLVLDIKQEALMKIMMAYK